MRNGIVKHSKGNGEILPKDSSELAATLEGQVVRVADIIAYVNHDMDDALRAGVLKGRTCRRRSRTWWANAIRGGSGPWSGT